ncbi:MAG TPA: HAD-IIIA family hydrolase [Tepidisphaeraceae bacterium]|nr:HAD-IIIA family hydrolase [Tepidisphaeraceae bacterium]
MPRAAVFFDRDNTLIINDGYLGDPAGVILVPDAPAAVAKARALGFAVVTVSNQSGVARGRFTELDVKAVDARMDALLMQADPRATIDRHEFCPYHPEAEIEQYRINSDLRKPRPGMILQAAHALDLDLPNSWLIGDSPRDIAAGKAAGCRAILVQMPDLPISPAADVPATVQPDYVARSLTEAVQLIEQNKKAQS